jgi:hypothetical protein
MAAVMKHSARRRESASLWFRQLLAGQERQGTAKAAAAAWLGTIYALRASARLDGNKEWGKVGDDMIGILENAYLENMGKEGASQIEVGRRLLKHHEQPAPIQVPQITVDKMKIPVIKPAAPLKFEKPAFLDKTRDILRAQARKSIQASKASAAKANKAARAKATKKK